MAKITGFTPVLDTMVAKYGLMTASVWGRVWRYEQMSKGVCNASYTTIAEGLDISPRTVARHIKQLVTDGYLEEIEPVTGATRTLKTTEKAGIIITIAGQDAGGPLTESHTPPDRESYKERSKKELKKKDSSPNGDGPAKIAPPTNGKAPAEPTPAQAMFEALAEVCGYDLKRLTVTARGILNREGKQLREAGYSAEFVRDVFSPWWYRSDFRGQKKQKPTPDQVVKVIGTVPVDNFDDYEADLERRRVVARKALEAIHEAANA